MGDHTLVNEPAKAIVVEETSPPALYALIIGINTYPNLTPLNGAVNDADAMSDFLTSDLHVPVDHITNLRNESASRANIIRGFQDLRDDPRIKKGDPILVYYAGHGGSHPPSARQKQMYGSFNIQVIFPHDYKVQPPGGTEPINCIPDKTISTLLGDLATVKGNNLTVIFDSCHSASATRQLFDGTRRPRDAEVTMEIPDDIDMDIISSRSVAQGSGRVRYVNFSFTAHQLTHVHLAACGDEERAWEENGRGAFTVALLKNIRAHGVDRITYHNLAISLPNLPRQTPHVFGANTDRTLFNARVPSRKIVLIPVKYVNGVLVLQAGAASGVTYQSVWELYDSPTHDSSPLGRFYARAPKVSTVELEPEKGQKSLGQPTGQLYARQIGHGSGDELKVWFSPEAKHAIFKSSNAGSGNDQPGSNGREIGYVVHDERGGADISVELSGSGAEKEVVFHLNDSRAEEYGVATLQKRKPVRRDEVEKVLFAASKWRWHLQRTSELPNSKVTMELVKFLENTGDAQAASYEVLDSTTGLVDFVAQPDDSYGIKVGNSRSTSLYVRVFYFGASDFGIVSLLGPSVSNARTDTQIPARGYAIIGRELGSEISFTIDPDLKLELGYIKLFWSTDPLELEIDQPSPFEEPGEEEPEPSREVVSARHLFKQDWGVVLLGVVNRPPQSEP